MRTGRVAATVQRPAGRQWAACEERQIGDMDCKIGGWTRADGRHARGSRVTQGSKDSGKTEQQGSVPDSD